MNVTTMTNLTCWRSRARRGSGRVNSLLSMPPGTACSRRHATAPFLSGHKAELALTARTV